MPVHDTLAPFIRITIRPHHENREIATARSRFWSALAGTRIDERGIHEREVWVRDRLPNALAKASSEAASQPRPQDPVVDRSGEQARGDTGASSDKWWRRSSTCARAKT